MWSSVGSLAVIGLLVATLMMAPAGLAQTTPQPHLRLQVEPAEGRLQPGAEAVTVPVDVILECAPPDAAPAAEPMDVQLTVAADEPWVDVRTKPETVTFDPAECLDDGPVTKTVDVAMAVADDAPGGVRFDVEVSASLSSGKQASAEWEQQVAIVLAGDAWLGETAYQAGPNSQIGIPVHIQNTGNAALAATFKLADDSSDALVVALPGLQTVDPGREHAVLVDLKTPYENGHIDRNDTVRFIVVLSSAVEEGPQQEKPLSASIHTVGSYVPGPGPLLLVALVGLVAALRRGTAPKQ